MGSLRKGSGLLLLASTWFYFLVFAQFALLHKVEALCTPVELKWMLGGMTLFGIGGALVAGALCQTKALPLWIGGTQALAVVAALLAGLAQSSSGLWVPSVLTGLALGVLTVAVVAWLDVQRLGRETALLVGAGTGLAYFLANVPNIFRASPERQSLCAALACGLGALALTGGRIEGDFSRPGGSSGAGRGRTLPFAVLVFGGLVWVDSAAFAWMQSVPSFREAGWANGPGLWSIGAVHGLAALGTGYLLFRGTSVWAACLTALAVLLIGFLMIVPAKLGLLGVWVYMTGVSIYSTALVAYPFLTDHPGPAASTASWLFALSGWGASAMGIGMVEDLGKMPKLAWVVGAVVVGLGAWPLRKESSG